MITLSCYKKVKIYIGDEFYNEYVLKKIDESIYEYQDDSCKNKIEFINELGKITRENDEFLLEMASNQEQALYTLKELNYELDISINYFDIIKENNNLLISYQLETNDKEVRLVLEGE